MWMIGRVSTMPCNMMNMHVFADAVSSTDNGANSEQQMMYDVSSSSLLLSVCVCVYICPYVCRHMCVCLYLSSD